MEYLEAHFTISCPDSLFQTACDLLADAAAETGFESFEETADGLKGYVQKTLFDQGSLDRQIAEFPLQDTTISYSVVEAENKDWNKTWEDNGFAPIDIDGKLVIADANNTKMSDHSTPVPQYLVKIDAKLAFGTGTHETTQMIVSTLLSLAESHGGSLAGKRVLDCGCGTGILGLVASKLGAREVVGYDIDEWSVLNTRHNAEINDVKNIRALLGDASVLRTIEGTFDIILANINRNILLNDMEAMRSKMTDESVLIISGFYEEDIPLLVDKAKALRLILKEQKGRGLWRCLVFTPLL